jgi:hypothetical protein
VLTEELRRDEPNLADRSDPGSEEMAKPTDRAAVAASIDANANDPRHI